MSCLVRYGCALTMALALSLSAHAGEAKIKVLFLGDKGHHQPVARFRLIEPVLAARGIALTYTDGAAALNADTLAKYDGLLIYANTEKITPAQEKALLDYVASGKGFIPIHCASFCFLNSPKYVELVGAQFLRHGTGTFRTTVAGADHPIVKGYGGFESWDETYVHAKHNDKDRTILEYRVDRAGKEPWTWVRTHGKGRVFYTAWGHDSRTWNNAGFHTLIERGIRWAVGAELVAAVADVIVEPQITTLPKDAKPFEYVDAKIPYYPPGKGGGPKGKAPTKMQLPVEPAESMKHMVTPTDFDIKLFAADPKIKRPICMNWDERGRLWIAESIDYPNERKPPGQGRDRIVICEDTDGDGLADKFTVFADNLSVPTSFAFAKGGVVVHQAPHTLFLKDNDGDDVADERRTLFSGWLTYDTHAGPSNLHYGFDNWLYGIVGYAGFDGEVGGERHTFRQGFYRFAPDGAKLEFLRSTNNNSWGVGFSEEGLLFGSTANGNPSVYLPIPNRYYERVRGMSSSVLAGIAGNARMHPITDKVRQVDFHGRFTAAAGHALYTARLYPRAYWNRAAFVTEPTGHLVATFQLERDGTNFTSRNAWNLLASDDEWTAPIMAEVGPDGCVWIIDWYNYIVQHNPTPLGFKTGKGAAYETPLRDKTHGRIYRLVPKDGKVAPVLSLKNATPEKLVAALKNDNLFWRRHAQRLLVERGKLDVHNALAELINDQTVDEMGINPGAIHALWTLHGLGALEGANAQATPSAVAGLKHKSAAVRRNAVAVLPRSAEGVKAILEAKLLDDADAHVRLATLLALADMPASEDAGRAIAAVLNRPANLNDRWIPDALTSAAAVHNFGFLSALTSSKQAPAARPAEVLAVVAEHYARGGPTQSVLNLLKTLGGADPKVAEIIIAGLSKGWPKNTPVALAAEAEDALQKLLPNLSPAAKGKLITLASMWGSKAFAQYVVEISKSLLATIENEKESDQPRINAARQLVELANEPATLEKLLDVVSPRASPTLAEGIIDAVGASASPAVGPALLKRLGSLAPSARAAGLRVLLARPEATRALLAAMEAGKVSMTELTLDQKEALSRHPDKKIAARARKVLALSGGLPNADRQKVVEELLPLTERKGNAVDGRLVFKKHCAACHIHAGEGGKVGPDLTGMATHPKSELLIHLIDPSRSVEGNYRVYTVATLDGRLLSGLLSSETKTSVEIIDSLAKKHVVLRADIDQIGASNKSLMPDGFEKQVTPDELVNLLEFLTQRGQYLPLALAKIATVVSTQGMFFAKDSTVERLVLADWSPKTVKGVPFHLVDPQGDKVPNVLLLYGPQGQVAPTMPKSAKLACNSPAKAIHLLSGVSGWGFAPGGKTGALSMIVRLHYADGKTEDHPLLDGEHFADYIRRIDVPKSDFAFSMRGKQMRYLSIRPKREEAIAVIEFVKGEDRSAPIVMAVTVETR